MKTRALLEKEVPFLWSNRTSIIYVLADIITTSGPITLEENVWIGANAVICGGVTIGKGAVIGAGSVVTCDIPAGVVAAGTPCRPLRPITEADKMDLSTVSF